MWVTEEKNGSPRLSDFNWVQNPKLTEKRTESWDKTLKINEGSCLCLFPPFRPTIKLDSD